MSTFLLDARYATRQLLRRPLFALAAIMSLALGLGVNTALFSVTSATLLQSPPAGNPGQLVRIYVNHHSPFRYPDYRYIKEHNTAFSHVVGDDMRFVSWSLGSEVERGQASIVSGDYFAAMQIRPAYGRFFARARDDLPAATAEVVLSWRFWQSHFGGDPSVVGRVVRINDHPFVVLGVAPDGFTSALTLFAPDFFVPMGDTQSLLGAGPEILGGGIYLTGRLRPGVPPSQANVVVSSLMHQLVQSDSTNHAGFTARVGHARGINAEMEVPLVLAAAALQIVALLVLLVACANVGNLLLARNQSRRREIGIRLAIGAGRMRIVRQLLTESAMLSGAAVVLALGVTWWMQDLVNLALPAAAREIFIPVSMNAWLFGFAAATGVLAILVAGLAPALQAVAQHVQADLGSDSGLGAASASRTRRTFLFAQVALTTILLAVAGLFGRSLLNASQIDGGYPSAGIVDITARLASSNVPAERRLAFWNSVMNRLREHSWAQGIGYVSTVPLTGSKVETTVWIEGRRVERPEDRRSTQFTAASPSYFAALQIPLREGRAFVDEDRAGSPEVAIVNETFAREYLGGVAIGRRVSLEGDGGPWAQIVGVARDIKYNSLGESAPPFLYRPLAQTPDVGGTVQLAVRPRTTLNTIRQAAIAAVHEADPSVAPPDVDWLTEEQRIVVLPARLTAVVLGSFGALALLLASVGIFAVATFAVAQRTREIGLRSALGAPSTAILRSVLGETAWTVSLAAGGGIAVSIVLGALLRSALYGIGPFDLLTFIVVPLVLILAAMGASYIPARRALRVDPAQALRGD